MFIQTGDGRLSKVIARHLGAGLALVLSTAAASAQVPANPYSYSRESAFEYFGAGDGAKAGLLKIERVEPSNPNLCVETEYSYDDHGNRVGSTTRNCAGASGRALFASRSSASSYAAYNVSVQGVSVSVPAGTFARTSSNALAHSETRSIDPRFGAVVSLTGPNSLTTQYELDDWGRVVKESRADGTSTKTLYCLIAGRVADTSSNSDGCGSTGALSGLAAEIPSRSDGWRAVSYVQVQSFDSDDVAMGPPQRVYKDAEGRTLRELTQGFNGGTQASNRRWIVKDSVYNAYGVAVVSTGTYFLESGSPSSSGSNDMALSTTTVDALGRPTAVHQRDPKGSSTATFGSYGSHTSSRTLIAYSGLTTTTTNELGQSRVEEKNVNGLLVRVTDATGAQLAHQHDAFGNLLRTKDALQHTISLSYDIRGRKLGMIDPDTGDWRYDYNALGELVWQQSPNQRAANPEQATTMAYDLLGRMTQRVAETTGSWTYDNCPQGVGKLCASGTNHGVSKSYAYDNWGRPVSTRVAISGGPSFNSAVSYQLKTGRLQTQTYPTGVKVEYVYTSTGFLSQVRLPQAVSIVPDTTPGQASGATENWLAGKVLWSAGSVNARGQSESQSLGNGVNSRAIFDGPTGRIDALSAGPGSSTSVAYHSYVWDGLGNLKTRTDHLGDGVSGAVTDTYSYDALNRLTQYQVEAVAAANLTRTVQLQYNAIGNLLHKSDVGNYIYSSSPSLPNCTRRPPHAVAKVVMAGQTREYCYDANGNAVSATAGAWRSISYTSFNLPDGQNGAQGPSGLQYRWYYDENHQRLRETRVKGGFTRTTWSLHPDNQGGLAFETESTGTNTNLNRHYINAGGQMLVIVTRESLNTYAPASATAPRNGFPLTNYTSVKVEFWHKDHLGSLIATTNHAGAVTQRYAYDPFGKRRQASGQYDAFGTLVIDWVDGASQGTDRGWTGHEHLDDIGIVHMNGRLFDPVIARFLQADPFIQDLANLQNYNRYTYCYNNPLICTDPTGFSAWTKFRNIVIRVVAMVADFNGCSGYCSAAVGAYQGYRSTGTFGGALVGGIQGYAGYYMASTYPIIGAGGSISWGNVAFNALVNGSLGCASSVAASGKCAHGVVSGVVNTIGSAYGLTGTVLAGCISGELTGATCRRGAVGAIESVGISYLAQQTVAFIFSSKSITIIEEEVEAKESGVDRQLGTDAAISKRGFPGITRSGDTIDGVLVVDCYGSPSECSNVMAQAKKTMDDNDFAVSIRPKIGEENASLRIVVRREIGFALKDGKMVRIAGTYAFKDKVGTIVVYKGWEDLRWRVVPHELGHLLGLGEGSIPGTVMGPGHSGSQSYRFTEVERMRIINNYGPKPSSAAAGAPR